MRKRASQPWEDVVDQTPAAFRSHRNDHHGLRLRDNGANQPRQAQASIRFRKSCFSFFVSYVFRRLDTVLFFSISRTKSSSRDVCVSASTYALSELPEAFSCFGCLSPPFHTTSSFERRTHSRPITHRPLSSTSATSSYISSCSASSTFS
jgi:hypothetical protein